MTWQVPLAAAAVAAAFTAVVARRYLASGRRHQLAWTAGLALYALASLAEAAVALWGWTPLLYRLYFPAAAGLVGALGAGTVYLTRAPRLAGGFAALVGLLILVAAVGQFAVPLQPGTLVTDDGETRPLSRWGPELGGAAVPFPQPARVAFLLLNVLGGLALILGAVASWWRTRAWGVLLIGVGAVVPFSGGSLSTLGVADARVLLQLVGIVVMFAGYLLGSRAAPAGGAEGARGGGGRGLPEGGRGPRVER